MNGKSLESIEQAVRSKGQAERAVMQRLIGDRIDRFASAAGTLPQHAVRVQYS